MNLKLISLYGMLFLLSFILLIPVVKIQAAGQPEPDSFQTFQTAPSDTENSEEYEAGRELGQALAPLCWLCCCSGLLIGLGFAAFRRSRRQPPAQP